MFFESSLGINITNNSLALVHLKKSFKKIRAAEHGFYSLEAGQSRDEIQASSAGLIRNFIRKNRIKSENIFLGIARDSVLLKYVELPLAVKENLRKILVYEIEKYFPLPVDDIYFDYQILKIDKNSNQMELLLVVVKKEMLAAFSEIEQEAGVNIAGIEINSTALANYFFFSGHGSNRSYFAIADIGKNYLELDIVKKGILLYSKYVTLEQENSNSIAATILQELEFASSRMSGDISKTETSSGSFHLVLSGSRVDEGLLKILEQKEDIDLAPAEEMMNHLSYDMISAFGLALKGMTEVPMQINLAPAEFLKKPSKAGRNIFLILLMLSVLLGLGWAGSHFLKERMTLNRLNSEIETLRPQVIKMERLQKEFEKIEDRINCLSKLSSGKGSILRVLDELSRIVPENAWVKNLTYQGAVLEIEGYAETASELIPLLERSPLFEDVSFKSTIIKDKSGKETFNIRMTVSAED